MPRFSDAVVPSMRKSSDARSFDSVQLHLGHYFSPLSCSKQIRGWGVAKCRRICMAPRLDSIGSVPSRLGLLLAEEIWLQFRSWGADRDGIRCHSSHWSNCAAHISTDGMALGGTPPNLRSEEHT